MQKVQQIILVVFGIAIIALFVIVFNENKNSVVTNESKNNDTTVHKEHKIAFVNVDSLLKKYKFYEVLEQKLMDKQKSLESDLNRKMAAFEKEAQEFQRKVQTNSFLSQESAQRQEQELMVKQQNLYKLREDLSNELAMESQNLEKQLLDTVTNFLKEFNANKKYDYILNKAAMLYGDEGLDITDTLVNLLNNRYEPKGK
ncbi:MAG TPA: OmpH family outer membrane protein [Bacteroidales bacterium]|jgi:outer membrane protein|nr:OmpH family outer membrane protein [Bacteroidales bacterium]